MRENVDIDRYYAGKFKICGKWIVGNLIYNKEKGVTKLDVTQSIIDIPIGSYGDVDIITGILNSGQKVTLFHNRCIKNHVKMFQNQHRVFVAEYSIWSNRDVTSVKYNKLECVLKNALNWSKLSALDTSDRHAIKFKDNENKSVHWFGATITFSTSLNCDLFSIPRKDESKVVEHLVVSIEADKKQDTSYFIAIRNKVISLISFAIRDNVNVEEQYLYDYDDSFQNGEYTVKNYLYTSEHRLSIHNLGRLEYNLLEYNFTLPQLLEKDIEKELTLLEPIFNLYLSLFKYTDMPPEMVFLNIVQALETFHARFFHDNNKEKYVASVKERFESRENFYLDELLLCATQKDKNCNYIILKSRLSELLIGKDDGLFEDYYRTDPEFAQTVTDTRHYYTHYEKSKEKKALKGDKLIDAIAILALLLEYNICLQLGIDNQAKVRERLRRIAIASRKQFQNYYQKESEQKKT